MLAGAALTWLFIPDTRDPKSGENISLEDLAEGRRREKRRKRERVPSDPETMENHGAAVLDST